jgi:hypothetical protein
MAKVQAGPCGLCRQLCRKLISLGVMRGGDARAGVEDVLAPKATSLWKSSGQCNGPDGALSLMGQRACRGGAIATSLRIGKGRFDALGIGFQLTNRSVGLGLSSKKSFRQSSRQSSGRKMSKLPSPPKEEKEIARWMGPGMAQRAKSAPVPTRHLSCSAGAFEIN